MEDVAPRLAIVLGGAWPWRWVSTHEVAVFRHQYSRATALHWLALEERHDDHAESD
jgi:hypothetical protein